MLTCRVAAIADMADREAVCAALSLEEIPEDGDVPANADVVLIICTTGSFHSTPSCLKGYDCR